MKSIFKKNGRRILSAMLCLLMAVTALPMSAFAWTSEEGKSCTSSFGDKYVGSDGQNYYSKNPQTTIFYNADGSIYTSTYSAGNARRKYMMCLSAAARRTPSRKWIPQSAMSCLRPRPHRLSGTRSRAVALPISSKSSM